MITVLNSTRSIFIGKLLRRLTKPNYFAFSELEVQDIRAKYLLIAEDKKGQLQYMREVETQDGKRGIVLKIQQPFSAYVALYEPLGVGNIQTLKLKNINIPWQQSVNPILKQILSNSSPSIYNMNNLRTYSSSKNLQASDSNNDRRVLSSLSPILQINYDLAYGDMINFVGCLGSRKTTTALNIAQNFTKKANHTSIFINIASLNEVRRAVQETGSWGLEAGSANNQTDAGVYMLAAKAIHLATLLSKAQKDTLLVFDGFRHILQAEWHMVQLLNNNKKTQKQLPFKAPRLPPISILNQIYANCVDNKIKNKKGSFTAILTTQNSKGNDELMPEVTPYSNNLKHLDSLAKQVKFPLTYKHSPAQRNILRSQDQDLPSYQQCQMLIRKKINEYLIQKKETQLKRKLYKTDMKDAPWDYYELLDAQWWMKSLQNTKIKSFTDLENLLTWIWLNIQFQIVANWKVTCDEGFNHYREYLQRQNVKIGRSSLQNFIKQAKLQGIYSPFKKDYLN